MNLPVERVFYEHPKNQLKKVSGKILILIFAGLGLAFSSTAAVAQDTSLGSPIRLVVPFPPGIAVDSLARKISKELGNVLQRNVIVENRPGAAGNIGTEHVVNSPADGTTLLITVNSPITVNPLLYSKLRSNPREELSPIANLATGGYLLVAKPGFPHTSAPRLISAAKSQPDVITYGSYGPGSMSHICMELLQSVASIKLRHIPNKLGSVNDLLGGHVDIAFEPLATVLQHVNQKSIVPIGFSHQAIASIPDMPLLSEQVPGFKCSASIGVFAPRKTPPALLKKLSDELTRIAATPDFIDTAAALGLSANPMSMDKYASDLRGEHERWKAVLGPLNLRLD